MDVPDPAMMEMESEVARERFLRRILLLAVVSIAVDVGAALLAYWFERGAPNAFATVWEALFWTTTQLLTVSSQLPNPQNVPTKFLDVVLEFYAIVVVTSLAATFTDALHHRTRRHVHERHMARAAATGDAGSVEG